MMKMQMFSAFMVSFTMVACSHRPSRDQTSISLSRASKSARLFARSRLTLPTTTPEALLTTLCATSNTPMTIFHVLLTMSTAQAVLNTHLKMNQVSTSPCMLFLSVMIWISSIVITMARITPAMGRITLSERLRIML